MVPTNKFSIKNLVNTNTKDKIPVENKSGAYQINCKECDKIYIGKTKRNLKTRTNEHFRIIKYRQIEKSAVAAHYCPTGHELNPVLKLLTSVSNKNEMTMWENLLILKNKDQVINFEIPPCDVLSKKFILQPPDGGMSTPSGEIGSRELVDNGGTTPLKHVL